MAFTRMTFSPEDGLNNKAYYPTEPATEEEARAQIQGISDQIRAYLNDTLLEQLESVQNGQSGAEHIGSAAVDNVAGITVREQIADLKRQLDGLAVGSVPDGSIDAQKLADAAVTKDKLHSGALGWTLVAQSGVLDAAGMFDIPSQAGKSEMLVQFRNEEDAIATGFFIAPLDENGVTMPAAFHVYANHPTSEGLDCRLVSMQSATQLLYGLSTAENVDGETLLKRLYIYTR